MKTSEAAAPIPKSVMKTTILGGMASYLDGATIVSASIAFVYYKMGGFEITAFHMGALSAILMIGLAFGALIGGRLGDRYGRRRVFSIDLAIFLVGIALLTFAPSIAVLYIGAVIAGLAMGADIPVSIALVSEEAPPEHRGKLVAITQVLWIAGIIVTSILSNLVGLLGFSDTVTGRILFGHVLIVGIVTWLLRLRLPESSKWSEAMGRDRDLLPTDRNARAIYAKKALFGKYWPALISTGLFYLAFTLVSNTAGQFNAYLYTEVAGGSIETANVLGLIVQGSALIIALWAVRVVDTRWRMRAFVIAGLLAMAMLVTPAVAGVTALTIIIAMLALPTGGLFAGEMIYKVWSQELFPTLIRSTAQGATIFFCRFLSGLFALVTPALALANPRLLYVTLFVAAAFSFLLGLFWVARLPKVTSTVDEAFNEAVQAATGTAATAQPLSKNAAIH
jgi:inositol transporter-like SP family MFS transporter